MRKIKTITLCSSAAFYKTVGQIKEELTALHYKVLMPHTAERMRKSGDYDVNHYKIWFKDPRQYGRKSYLMRRHFAEVAKADAILVINLEKRRQKGYIGGNVLMEMGLAFYLRKRIFILNQIPKKSPLYEEVVGMMPTFINGDLKKLV